MSHGIVCGDACASRRGVFNCYAERTALRFAGSGGSYEGLVRITNGHPQWTGEVRFVEERLADPLRWKKPRRIFVNSMSDLFHPEVDDHSLDKIFAVMALCPQHQFQVLTKRPERMMKYVNQPGRASNVAASMSHEAFDEWTKVGRSGKILGGVVLNPDADTKGPLFQVKPFRWPLPNVWLGTSVENEIALEERLPYLVQTQAAVRWLSVEPLLEKLEIGLLGTCPKDWGVGYTQIGSHIHWVVVGGESGPGARPFAISWAKSLIKECRYAAVPVFVKQVGPRPIMTENSAIPWKKRMNDSKGGDMSEWPEWIRVRQYPTAT